MVKIIWFQARLFEDRVDSGHFEDRRYQTRLHGAVSKLSHDETA